MLAEDRKATERARRERDWEALRPSDPHEALDAHHFAERFGLLAVVAVLWALLYTRRSDYAAATSSSIASAESGAPQSSSEAGAGRL